MLQKAKNFITGKLGIAQNRFAIEQLRQLMDFLGAYINLSVPELIRLDPVLLETATNRLKEEYPLGEFNALIHKNDIMFAFHVYHHKKNIEQAVYGYFKIGIRTATNLRQVAESRQIKCDSVLDFGSGYGRVSRFFPQVFPNAQISVSEVKAQALGFQSEQFGFGGLLHGQEATSLTPGKYDLILALSVFTHLPKQSFVSWFKRLLEDLNPGGALIFTINNLAGSKYEKNAKDFHYLKLSEDSSFSFVSDSLSDTEEYGSTFVSYAYIGELARKEGANCEFIQHELTPSQEAVILRKNQS